MTGSPPPDWREAPLIDVAEVRSGLAKGRKDVKEPVTLPYLRVANVQDGHLDLVEIKEITLERDKVERYRLHPGDVLLTEGGDFDKLGRGTVWRGEIPVCLHQNHVFAVRCDPSQVIPAYLSALTGSTYGKKYFLGAAKQTTNLASINSTQLKGFPVLLPPLPEQRKIAAILSVVGEVIEKTEAVVESLQALKKAMMQELLTRGLPGRHTRFKQTEVGEIPEAWTAMSVGDAVECCDYGLSEKMSADDSLTPILRMGNIQDGEVVLEGLKYVDDALATAKGLHLAPGDVLFNRTNSRDLVGKVGVFLGARGPVTFASYLLRMKVKPEVGKGSWLGAVLNTDQNQAALRALATPGVSQANINRTKLLALQVPTPPAAEQEEILSTLDSIGQRVQAEKATLAATTRLKAALMSVLLTGELRVTPDQDAA